MTDSAEQSVPFQFQLAPEEAWNSDTDLILEGDLVTMDTPGILQSGRLLIRSGRIAAIVKTGEPFPPQLQIRDAQVIKTNGYIFPGFINLHTHMSYNFQPVWITKERYKNRYEWQKFQPHIEAVMMPKWILHGKWGYNLLNEETLFAEVRALVGGTTSIMQTNPGFYTGGHLVRNIEYETFNPGSIWPTTVELSEEYLDANGENVRNRIESGELRAWVVHLAEGVDQRCRDEFDRLKREGLLRSEVVIVHGTALSETQLSDLGRIGGHLVWSPTSNLLLYGATADVKTAIDMGVTVSLSNDWAPSATHNLLAELKVAAAFYRERYEEPLPPKLLAEMLTVNPARAIGWESHAGQLKVGLNADVIVFEKLESDPYSMLLKATEQHLQLVLVGGEPIYGNPILMQKLKPGDSEVLTSTGLNGEEYHKRVDVTKGYGDIALTMAQHRLYKALRFDPAEMAGFFQTPTGEPLDQLALEEYLQEKYKGLQPMELTRLFIGDDTEFFKRLEIMEFPYIQQLLSVYRPFDSKIKK